MHRFYSPHSDFSSSTILLNVVEEIHHVKNVLRARKGNTLIVFNGKGNEVSGEIMTISSHQIALKILSRRKENQNEPKIILACAIPKKSKFELIIEKATEVGVSEIIPLKTKRTEIDIKPEREVKKLTRFEKIAISASKQSQRLFIPKIHPVLDLTSAINYAKENGSMIIPSLAGNPKNIFKVFHNLKNSPAITFFIGPEGDFTDEEYQFAWDEGCTPVTLGKTILRVETAAISTVSAANLYFHS